MKNFVNYHLTNLAITLNNVGTDSASIILLGVIEILSK
jgi:hypothetical protein